MYTLMLQLVCLVIAIVPLNSKISKNLKVVVPANWHQIYQSVYELLFYQCITAFSYTLAL